MTTYEIKIANETTTLRTTRDGLLEWARASRPAAELVLRGYTTWRLVDGDRVYGAVREIG